MKSCFFFWYNTNIFPLRVKEHFSDKVSHSGWKPFQSLCFCGVADLTSSSEVHPEHLHPNCSCVNSKAHATGSCDTHIWYHYNEIMWVTGFLHYAVLAVSWPSDGYTFISVGTLRNCFVNEMLIIILFIVISYCLDVFFHWFKLGLF